MMETLGMNVVTLDDRVGGWSEMEIIKLGWLGIRTEQDRALAGFFSDVLGLPEVQHEEGFWVFRLPDGAKIEVFGPATSWNTR